MKKIVSLGYISLLTCSLSLFAADIPTVVEGAENFNKEACISSNTNDCIQSVCLTSSELDCNDQCKKAAIDKCEELSNE